MTPQPPIHDITSLLPPGWTAEPYSQARPDLVVVRAPALGHVTIDFTARCWRWGYATKGRGFYQRGNRGRGWRRLLIRDALVGLGGKP